MACRRLSSSSVPVSPAQLPGKAPSCRLQTPAGSGRTVDHLDPPESVTASGDSGRTPDPGFGTMDYMLVSPLPGANRDNLLRTLREMHSAVSNLYTGGS